MISPYLDQPLIPLAAALRRMLEEIETELADEKNPDSTATTVSAKGKSAVNGGVKTKRMRPMEVNEIGSDVPVEPEDRFEMANSTQHDGVADDGVG